MNYLLITQTHQNGNSVLYELVRCIFSYDSSKNLKSLGGSILGQFLNNKDNNYKYLALNTLNDIAKIDIDTVQKHKNVILEFLKDPDIAIKRRSLDLTYLIVNTENIRQIVTETLDFINSTSNVEFKLELTSKIFYSLEKYSPSLKWEIDVLLKMLCLCEDSINEEIIWKIINLILNTKELQQYAMFRYFLAMQNMLEDSDVEALYHVGIAILGELFQLIVGVSTTDEEGKTITITEDQIIDLIITLDKSSDTSETLRELLMNTCFKMIGKLSPETDEKLKKILHTESKSFFPEVQERANEYITFTQIAKNDMQLKITSNVPVPEFDKDENENSNNNVGEEPGIDHKDTIVEEYETDKGYRSLINGASVTGDSSGMQKPKKAKKEKKGGDDMQSMQNVQPQPTTQQNNAQPQGMDLFGDIFGSQPSGNAPVANPQSQTSGSNDIFNLLGNMGSNPNPASNTGAQSQGGIMDLNSILSGNNNQQSQPQPQNQQNNLQQNLKEVFKNGDISIYSSLIQNNNVYNGSFFISNNTNSQINDVVVNLLVKKYIACQIHATTGKDLAPNASLAIRKDVTMTNNDPNKGVVFKMAISYVKDGNNISESKIITL